MLSGDSGRPPRQRKNWASESEMKTTWSEVRLGSLIDLRNGINFTQASRGRRIKVIGVGDFQNREVLSDFENAGSTVIDGEPQPDDLLIDNDLLFVRSNGNKALVGRCVILRNVTEPIAFSGFTIRARVKDSALDPAFLSKLVRSDLFQRHLHFFGSGSSINNLSQDALALFAFQLPPIEEQRRIATILRTWDEAIDRVESLTVELVALNSALCQRAFDKEFASQQRLVRASSLLEPISEKARPDLPLLAVMQDVGVVRRDELGRRVAMPDGDTSTYKVVRPGDFVISLRSFEGGLEYSNVLGLVSPAYTVLRPIEAIHSEYYRHFFKSRSFIGRLDKLIFGIRDGKQIAFRDFGDMRIPHPPIDVQKGEAAALNKMRTLLDLNEKRKQALEKQKRGLMQKLLTGQWRVKADGGAL